MNFTLSYPDEENADGGIGNREDTLTPAPEKSVTTPATTPKTTPGFLEDKSIAISNEILNPSYTVVETANCDSFGNPKQTMVQSEPISCQDLSEDGFRCVWKGKIFIKKSPIFTFEFLDVCPTMVVKMES